MDLVKIGFLIQTNGLEKANKEVDSLLDKTSKIGTVSKKAAADAETSQKKVKKATEDSTKAADNNAKAVEKTSKALEKQKIIGDYLGKGLDKTTATSIANFKQLGASVTETSTMLNTLANNKGILQTRKDIEAANKAQQEHAKLVDQTIGKYRQLSSKSLGSGILDTIEQENKGLQELRKHYASLEKQQNKNISVVKEYETASRKSFGGGILDTIGKQDKGLQNLNAEYRAMEVEQAKLLNAEKRANTERQKAITLEQTKAKYIKEGFGKGSSTQLAKMELSGADVSALNHYKTSLLATSSALGSFAGSAKNAAEEKSKLTQQIKGIAFYAVLSTAIYGVMTAITALTVASVKMADEYTAIQNRMKLYIKDAGELGRVNAQLAQMSIENNVGLRETATLFSRLLPSMQRIGANTAAVTSVVDAFGKSMRIGGATAMEAASATIQFSQAMASGKLAGDEFRSISEASPRFLKAIADGSGIAAEKLKEMSSAGMLTTEVISKALLKEYPKLIEENKKLGITLEQGANAIKTGFLVAIGEFNEGAKITQYFGEMMVDLAQNLFKAAQGAREFGQDVKRWFTDNANTINLVVEAFKVLATVITTRYVVAVGLAVRESIRYQATLVTMAAQQANVTRSSLIMSSAITSVGTAMRWTLAFFGGWVGLALTVASATAAYLSFNSASGATAESFRQEGESLTATIDKYKELAKVKQQAVLDKEIANLEELNKQYDDNKAKLVTNVLNLSRHDDMTRAQAKSMAGLALAYKNGNISLDKLVSTVSQSGYVSNESKVKTRGFAEAVIDAGEKAGLSKDLIEAMRKALATSGEQAKIAKTGVDSFTKGLDDQAKKLRETTALAKRYGLEIASATKLQEQLSSRFGARETELPLKKQYYDKKAQEALARGDTTTANNWTKASLSVQSQQNSLLKEKNAVISQTVKGLKEVEAAQKEQSDYTEALRKAEKDSEKAGNKQEKDRKKYQDQAKELSAYITLLEEAQDVDVARIASEKEYQNAFGASLDQAKALYELRRQAEQVEARAVFVKNIAEEEEAQGRLVALMKAGLDIATARTLVEAKFTDNAKGKEAAEKYLTNMAYEQHYALADQIDSQSVMNNLLKQGYTIEQATFRLMTSRVRALNGDSTYLDDLDKAYDTQVKQLKAKQAETSVLQETDKLEKQKVAYINAQAAGYEKLALNMSIANKIEQNTDLTSSQANRLVEAEELVNYEKELADLKAKTYAASLKESAAVKDIIGSYTSLDSVQVSVLDRQRKVLEVAKELSDEAEKQRKNPLGDFSSVDFNVFGDFGNPFESALAGLNEFVSKSAESRSILASIENDIASAKEKGLSTSGLELERSIVLAGQEKDRKDAINKGITSTLALTKGLFNEESKGYKVVTILEQAFQAKKIAFAMWEKKEKLVSLAMDIKGYAITTGQFLASTAAKVAAQIGLNVTTGIGAILSAAQQPGPAAFVGFAAMAALVVGLGVAVGGMGKTSGSFAPTNEGTGTVFGDPTAKSESIKKSIDLLAENSDVTTPLTAAMLKSLQNIESNIGGLANLLIRNAPGSKLVEGVNQGFFQNSVGSFLEKAGKTVFAGVGDFLGINKMLGSLLGGLFGTKVSVKGQGLFGANQQLGDIVGEGFSLQEYVDIQTKKKSFGITTSKKNSTQYSAASQELENQFTLIFKGFNDAILFAAPILDKNTNEVANKLNDFVVSIGKVDLKGLNGEQIQEKLNAVFGAEADKMAQAAIGGLDDFQKVGEGYFETLVRVATSIEMATVYTDRLNVSAIKYTDVINKQGDTTTEIIRQSVLLNESNKTIKNGFYDLVNTFNGTANEITDFVLTLRDLQDAIVATGKSGEYLTSAMLAGAGGLDRLQDGLEAYFEILSPAEQAAELTRRITKEFTIFGEQVPASVGAFKALVDSIEINTEAGQKLYGQVIALTPEFMELQDALKKAEDAAKAEAEEARRLAEEARKAAEEAKKAAESLAKLRTAFFITGQDVSRLTQVMINAAGGVEAMQRGLDAMFEMLSPTEKAAELTRRLAIQFKALGLELPSSTDAFRVLVKEMNTSTNAGKALLGKVIALAPEFNELQKALESANNEVNQLVQSLRDLAEQARQARGETEQPRNLDYARAMFESTAMLAMQGDTTAANKLLSLGNNLMDLSKQYSTSGSEYARDLAWIQRAATISADVQEGGLGYTSTTLSTSLSGGNSTPTLATTSTSTDAEIKELRGDLNAALLAIAKYTQSTAKKLENWDDGNRVMVGVIQEIDDPKVPVTTT